LALAEDSLSLFYLLVGHIVCHGVFGFHFY